MRTVCPFHFAEKCDVIKDAATEKLSLFDVKNRTQPMIYPWSVEQSCSWLAFVPFQTRGGEKKKTPSIGTKLKSFCSVP